MLRIFVKNIRGLSLLILLAATLGSARVSAQSDSSLQLKSPELAKWHPWQTSLYLYGLWGTEKHGSMWTAIHGSSEEEDFYYSRLNVGVSAEFSKWDNLFKIFTDVGYTRGRLAFDRGLRRDGVMSNWLTLDVAPAMAMSGATSLMIGLKSDLFLGSETVNTADRIYTGIYPECFNRVTLKYYIGFAVLLPRVNFRVKFGGYLVPIIDPNKLTYHNFQKGDVEGLYFEYGASIRLFTTKQKYAYEDF